MKLHRGATFGEVSNAVLRIKIPEILVVSRSPEVISANSPIIGGAEHSARSGGRGGARNSAGRESYGLTAAQVGNLIAATAHAAAIGLPFTRMVTIHWQAAGVPLEDMAKATGRFIDLLSKALARHGSATAWLWVHENGDGKGGHLHLLVHVPADLVPILTGLQISWLRKITGLPYRKRVIRSDPIGGRLGLEIDNRELHATNLDAALAYILKGANAAAAKRFNLTRLESGGLVIGKRCGTSQNIGAKVRRETPTENNGFI